MGNGCPRTPPGRTVSKIAAAAFGKAIDTKRSMQNNRRKGMGRSIPDALPLSAQAAPAGFSAVAARRCHLAAAYVQDPFVVPKKSLRL
jgi:hypothetical protein